MRRWPRSYPYASFSQKPLISHCRGEELYPKLLPCVHVLAAQSVSQGGMSNSITQNIFGRFRGVSTYPHHIFTTPTDNSVTTTPRKAPPCSKKIPATLPLRPCRYPLIFSRTSSQWLRVIFGITGTSQKFSTVPYPTITKWCILASQSKSILLFYG